MPSMKIQKKIIGNSLLYNSLELDYDIPRITDVIPRNWLV